MLLWIRLRRAVSSARYILDRRVDSLLCDRLGSGVSSFMEKGTET